MEPEVVATSPNRIKSPVPVYCGFSSVKNCVLLARMRVALGLLKSAFESKRMPKRYYASVPADAPLRFPGICPFTGAPDPKSKIRLARTATTSSSGASGLLHISLLLFAGLHFSRTTTLSLRVPADRRFAWKARLIGFAMWSCFLAAVGALAVLFVRSESGQSLAGSAACLGSAILATASFKVWHYWLLRPIVLGDGSDYFVEVGFLSEAYAQEFAALNNVFLEFR